MMVRKRILEKEDPTLGNRDQRPRLEEDTSRLWKACRVSRLDIHLISDGCFLSLPAPLNTTST
jgi:hypothetical protein